jgi:TonB-dependent SusC/RagA subfamily outer membrane receptor
MIYKRIFVLAVALLGIAVVSISFTKSGDDVIKVISDKLEKWTSDYPQEKVYLHTDKTNYLAGESVWFKAYLVVGPEHQLSTLSNVLYVEFINDQDSIKQTIKLPIVDGYSWGDFELPVSLKEGNYRIRAYTNWMRNFSDTYFFSKSITVDNVLSTTVLTTTKFTSSSDNGVNKTEAIIKYTDIDGKPLANKQVSYNIVLTPVGGAKGKGVTDATGRLIINLISKNANGHLSGEILTQIKIDKAIVSKRVPLLESSSTLNVDFFPEGGDLVSGVRTRVAFKAITSDGLGIDVSGSIIDNDGKEITTFNTQHAGMGLIIMTPESGKSYSAKMTLTDGSLKTFKLPEVRDKAYVISINNADEETVGLKISASAAMFAENKNTEINVIAQSGGKIYYAAKTKLISPVFSAFIPKNRLPAGIIQFTLFSATGEPLNERLIFVQNKNVLKLNLNGIRPTYAPKEKVKIDLYAKNAGNTPQVGSFSVAVVNVSKTPVLEADEVTNLSQILLSSDLKGYIEQPNYYFINESDKSRADLDLLMLTQGYRRFEWKKILNGDLPPPGYLAEKSLTISGQVKTFGGNPAPGAKVTLLSTKNLVAIDTVADEKGRFQFDKLLFVDTVRFVVKAKNSSGKNNVEVVLDKITSPVVNISKAWPLMNVNLNAVAGDYIKETMDDYQRSNVNSILLKEVTIRERKYVPKVVKYSANLNGPGKADQIIRGNEIGTGCVILALCLQGKARGIDFNDGGAFLLKSRGREINAEKGTMRRLPMLLIVDGVTMDPGDLKYLKADDIEAIEILTSGMNTAVYGSNGAAGVIVITTKRGGEDVILPGPTPGTVTYLAKGYYKSRDFYSPKYEAVAGNEEKASFTTTVFWKPDIITDKDGKASLEFFNADSKGTYRVVVEGIDSDGNLARKVYRYKVQ